MPVAPFAGAWIEIGKSSKLKWLEEVAPFAGAWIEIKLYMEELIHEESHPSRVRGLKSIRFQGLQNHQGRTLRGCVDWKYTAYVKTGTNLCRTLRGYRVDIIKKYVWCIKLKRDLDELVGWVNAGSQKVPVQRVHSHHIRDTAIAIVMDLE